MTSQDDCWFFHYSTCTKGDACGYRHEPESLGSEIVCEDWREGACYVPVCKYRHMEMQKDPATEPCYWEGQPGGCRKPTCPYLHFTKRDNLAVNVGNLKAISIQESDSPRPSTPSTSTMVQGETSGIKCDTPLPIPTPKVDPVIITFDEESDVDSAAGTPLKQDQPKSSSQVVPPKHPELKALQQEDAPIKAKKDDEKSLEDLRKEKIALAKRLMEEADALAKPSSQLCSTKKIKEIPREDAQKTKDRVKKPDPVDKTQSGDEKEGVKVLSLEEVLREKALASMREKLELKKKQEEQRQRKEEQGHQRQEAPRPRSRERDDPRRRRSNWSGRSRSPGRLQRVRPQERLTNQRAVQKPADKARAVVRPAKGTKGPDRTEKGIKGKPVSSILRGSRGASANVPSSKASQKKGESALDRRVVVNAEEDSDFDSDFPPTDSEEDSPPSRQKRLEREQKGSDRQKTAVKSAQPRKTVVSKKKNGQKEERRIIKDGEEDASEEEEENQSAESVHSEEEELASSHSSTPAASESEEEAVGEKEVLKRKSAIRSAARRTATKTVKDRLGSAKVAKSPSVSESDEEVDPDEPQPKLSKPAKRPMLSRGQVKSVKARLGVSKGVKNRLGNKPLEEAEIDSDASSTADTSSTVSSVEQPSTVVIKRQVGATSPSPTADEENTDRTKPGKIKMRKLKIPKKETAVQPVKITRVISKPSRKVTVTIESTADSSPPVTKSKRPADVQMERMLKRVMAKKEQKALIGDTADTSAPKPDPSKKARRAVSIYQPPALKNRESELAPVSKKVRINKAVKTGDSAPAGWGLKTYSEIMREKQLAKQQNQKEENIEQEGDENVIPRKVTDRLGLSNTGSESDPGTSPLKRRKITPIVFGADKWTDQGKRTVSAPAQKESVPKGRSLSPVSFDMFLDSKPQKTNPVWSTRPAKVATVAPQQGISENRLKNESVFKRLRTSAPGGSDSTTNDEPVIKRSKKFEPIVFDVHDKQSASQNSSKPRLKRNTTVPNLSERSNEEANAPSGSDALIQDDQEEDNDILDYEEDDDLVHPALEVPEKAKPAQPQTSVQTSKSSQDTSLKKLTPPTTPGVGGVGARRLSVNSNRSSKDGGKSQDFIDDSLLDDDLDNLLNDDTDYITYNPSTTIPTDQDDEELLLEMEELLA